MKHLGLALAAATLFSPTASHAAPPAAAFGVPGFASAGTVSQFQVTDKTQVPGHQLKPGSYSITIVDQLNDRMVLRVNNSAGKEEATFIGLPAGSRLPKQGGQGPIAMTAKGSNKALRGFTFADGSVAEFVYPKEEAVALAKVNSTTIPRCGSGIRRPRGYSESFANRHGTGHFVDADAYPRGSDCGYRSEAIRSGRGGKHSSTTPRAHAAGSYTDGGRDGSRSCDQQCHGSAGSPGSRATCSRGCTPDCSSSAHGERAPTCWTGGCAISLASLDA